MAVLFGSSPILAEEITPSDFETAEEVQEALIIEDLNRRAIETEKKIFDDLKKEPKRLEIKSPTYTISCF